jgi:cobalt-zinc-cadmium resistance protein CzcA
MGFAGKSAGMILEGEKKFDVVVRFEEGYRKDLDDLRNALVDLPDGTRIPLHEFAEIDYTSGPAKISRDNTRRRVVIGVNVRGSDLESVVSAVAKKVKESVKLPAGYYVEYGGQFENLQNAKNRLMVAVPIALVLIFVLLYFAFESLKDTLLIYTAIPLAAIGGVLALWSRGMPFSISAGVGFIALFGIAVLNGIVMIEHFKELRKEAKLKLDDLIIAGAKDRIRPVLLTAVAAAMGFLPMAISTSAGAEVQRPLATVVIGGLVSATALTLIILPVLYRVFNKEKNG